MCMANREGVRTEDTPFFTFYDQSSRWAMKSLTKTREIIIKRGKEKKKKDDQEKGFFRSSPPPVHYECILSVMLV